MVLEKVNPLQKILRDDAIHELDLMQIAIDAGLYAEAHSHHDAANTAIDKLVVSRKNMKVEN